MSIVTRIKTRARKSLEPQVPDFCPSCDSVDSPFASVQRKVLQEFRGDTLEVEAPAMRCRHCGFEIAVAGSLDVLRLATADAYRQRHGLLTSSQIVSRRVAMGMAQRDFADHVGVGVASLQRWETGLVVQDKGSDLLIRERTKHTLFAPGKFGCTACVIAGQVTVVRVSVSHSAIEKHGIVDFFRQEPFEQLSSTGIQRRTADVATFVTQPMPRHGKLKPAVVHRWNFDQLCDPTASYG